MKAMVNAVTGWVSRSENAAVRPLQLEEAQWLKQVLASVCRVAARCPEQAQDWPGMTAWLRSQGVTTAPVTVAKWMDDSIIPPTTKVVVCGSGGLHVILARNDKGALVLRAGTNKAELVPFEAVHEWFVDAQAFALGQEEESSEAYGWRWFFTAFLARKAVVRDTLITSFVIQLIALAFPLATQAIVDKVITNQATSTLIALGTGIALFALFNGIMTWLRQKLLLRLANVVDAELSTRIMAHLFRLPMRFFEQRPTGVLMNRVRGAERVREFASGAFLLIALELPFSVIFLGLMLWYSPMLSGVVLAFVATMTILSFACGPTLRRLANKQFEAGAKVQGFLTERVAAYETVKTLRQEDTAVMQFDHLNRRQLNASLETSEFANGYSTTMQVLEQLMNVSVLCLGAYLAMTSPGLTIGMLVTFQMFAQRVAQPLLKLSGVWQQLQQVRTAVAQLGDVMSAPTERYGSAPTSAGRAAGAIKVEGLSFRYAADRPPLYKDLNFSVEPGQVALVTGQSGSGKSTLAKVMLGLYTGHEGFVRIDGRDSRSMPVNELRELFGVVSQETVLFSGTILENVLAGCAASMEDAVQACKLAGIHSAIENMSDGYQTLVGERGVGLSGGQRQRIGIARALLRRPSVLLFDEATSALDSATAEHIGQTVNLLRGHVTVIFIAHKIPQCLKVDKHIELGK